LPEPQKAELVIPSYKDIVKMILNMFKDAGIDLIFVADGVNPPLKKDCLELRK